jgi:hypothetical protein
MVQKWIDFTLVGFYGLRVAKLRVAWLRTGCGLRGYGLRSCGLRTGCEVTGYHQDNRKVARLPRDLIQARE